MNIRLNGKRKRLFLPRLLIGNGCRQATAGEYTQRAFPGGKMDLSQAEAVADLIASQSAAPQNIKALCLKVRNNQYLCGQINKMKQS